MWNEGSHWSSWASAGGQNPASLTREGIERVDFYKKHDWISQLCCRLPPLASHQVLLLAGSWSCQGPEMCFWSYIPGGFAFLSQASVGFAAGHLSPLRSSQSWTVLTLRVAACVCLSVCPSVFFFFFLICAFPLWNAGILVVSHSGNPVWPTSLITLSCLCSPTAYTSFFLASAYFVPG